ncbi:chloride channel CLIC-like protein 1 isoform X2 [Hippoglossus hippoglossus]|uniref:chloride channel CLIC-like protein 1 isoform X2 n=1 Tax=Hippoglossus hippoglossus TaxID=8267 RepID=UPI00148DF461|nr:chloride channel CLIC-like protein 1 isoform X2 [Hippoglossus hippoglossus]
MVLALLVCSLVLVSAVGQQADDDRLHYDSTSKTMRKPTEIEEQKKKISLLSGQPTCNPVFKRFLSRLLREMQRVGLPTDSSDAFYDAKVGVSKQAIAEIQTLLDGKGSFTTGPLDTAVSQILVNLKPHDYEAWKWRFEDSFGVPAHYDNVATKRREYTEDPSQAELVTCRSQVADLQKKIEEQKKKISLLSDQPTCNPVFKRFLSRLLKEMQRVGLPTDSSDAFYDAKVGVSKQTELDTLLKMGLCVLVMMAIICTQLWSRVSWFVQFTRLFAVCFFVSIVWNWFYLYKIAFAERQNNLAKMDSVNEKCTGMKKIYWSDSLKEWYRSTWTLQDDPCKSYYEHLIVDPILLVPPTKAISVTIATFITEPMKHIGQGISEFLRALLKDLPVTLQIPVLVTIVLVMVVFVYVSVQAAFLHGIMAPLRRRGPPPPGLQPPQQQPQAQIQGVADHDHLAGRDTQQQGPRQQVDDGRAHRNPVHQRHPNRPREKKARVVVQTLQSAASSEDETDTEQQEGRPEAEQNLTEESDAENQVENKEEPEEAGANSVAAHTAQAKTKTTPKAKPMRVSENRSQDQHSGDDAAPRSQPAGNPPSHTDVKDLEASAGHRTSSVSETHVETLGVPVQESCPVPEE